MIGVDYCSSLSIPVEVSGLKKDSAAALDSEAVVIEHSLGYTDTVMSESDSAVAKDIQVNGSIYSFSSEEIST
jgi:ubiquitin carboxyl-terminal hydrolase 36/42